MVIPSTTSWVSPSVRSVIGHPENASPMFASAAKETVVRDVHPEKAPEPKVVQDGRLIEVSAVHPENAVCPTPLMPSAPVIDFRVVHPSNIYADKDVRSSGISMLVRLAQYLKTPFPIFVRPEGSATDVIFDPSKALWPIVNSMRFEIAT